MNKLEVIIDSISSILGAIEIQIKPISFVIERTKIMSIKGQN